MVLLPLIRIQFRCSSHWARRMCDGPLCWCNNCGGDYYRSVKLALSRKEAFTCRDINVALLEMGFDFCSQIESWWITEINGSMGWLAEIHPSLILSSCVIFSCHPQSVCIRQSESFSLNENIRMNRTTKVRVKFRVSWIECNRSVIFSCGIFSCCVIWMVFF